MGRSRARRRAPCLGGHAVVAPAALKAWGLLLFAAIFALFALPFFGPLLTG